MPPVLVMDTNVFISSLRSNAGASFKFVELIGLGHFELAVSVPVVFEYRSVAQRLVVNDFPLTDEDIERTIKLICAVSILQPIFYLWRPTLSDPKDDMILELAVASGSQTIVTYNVKDFTGADKFGVRAITPKDILRELELIP